MFPKPMQLFLTGVVHAGRTGDLQARGQPTLIIVGKGEEGTPDMMHRPLPRLCIYLLYNFPQNIGT